MAIDTIPEQPDAAKQFAPEPLDHVCDMEDPLREIHDLMTGLMHMQNGEFGAAVCTIADIARDKCARVQELRDMLFHVLHPNREAA